MSDLPDHWRQLEWRHLAEFYREAGGNRLVRRIGLGLRTGYFWRWPIGAIIKRHAIRCTIAATFGAGLALGYNQGRGQARLDAPQTTREATYSPIRAVRDERCELEPMQSPPVMWLAAWKHEVRAFSNRKVDATLPGVRYYEPLLLHHGRQRRSRLFDGIVPRRDQRTRR